MYQKVKKLTNFAPTIILPPPRKCVISITDECSMRCKMCYNWTLNDNPENVKSIEWINVIREISNLKKDEMLINFIGGEPLEKPWILDIIKEATNLGLKTSLTTNATIINQAMPRRIINSGLSTLAISLDSLSEETHDYYRGIKGTFKSVMNTIETFEKMNKSYIIPELIIQTIIMDKNLEELFDLVNWVQKKEIISGIFFMSIMKPHHTNLPDDWYRNDKQNLWPKDISKLKETIDKLISLKKEDNKIVNSPSHLENYIRYYTFPNRFIKKKPCNVMDFGIYIDAQGNVSICSDKGIIGNIKKKNLENIWYSNNALRVKRRMKNCKKNCEFLVNCFYEDEI